MKQWQRFWLAGVFSAALLGLAPTAFAAQSGSDSGSSSSSQPGVTSGPAVGTHPVPNTAVTKNADSGQFGGNGNQAVGSTPRSKTAPAAVGVGAPGTPAEQGVEAGTAPSHKPSNQ